MGIQDDIKARYDKTEVVTDTLGRAMKVKPLRASQVMRIYKLAETELASVVNPMILAASVVDFNGTPISFPQKGTDAEWLIDALDVEGLEAVSKALTRLGTNAPKTETEAMVAAKE